MAIPQEKEKNLGGIGLWPVQDRRDSQDGYPTREGNLGGIGLWPVQDRRDSQDGYLSQKNLQASWRGWAKLQDLVEECRLAN